MFINYISMYLFNTIKKINKLYIMALKAYTDISSIINLHLNLIEKGPYRKADFLHLRHCFPTTTLSITIFDNAYTAVVGENIVNIVYTIALLSNNGQYNIIPIYLRPYGSGYNLFIYEDILV